MKKINLSLLVCMLFAFSVNAQENYPYEVSAANPYGLPNPDMPEAFLDFDLIIGEWGCKSLKRIDQNTWADTLEMTWRYKYIMNGTAVQDETLHTDGTHAGSIRQYNADSARWYVHYYSSRAPSAILPAWEGNKNEEGDIILYRDQKAPNGTPGNFKITFYDISEKGFNWSGEWVSKDESFKYPTWHIFCDERKE